jgi:hypothetical protein
MTIHQLCGQIDTAMRSLEDLFWQPRGAEDENSRFISCIINITQAQILAEKILPQSGCAKQLECRAHQIEKWEKAWDKTTSLTKWRVKRRKYFPAITSVLQELGSLKSQLEPNQREIPISSSCFTELFKKIDCFVGVLSSMSAYDARYFASITNALFELCDYFRINFPHSYTWGLEDHLEPVLNQVNVFIRSGSEGWNMNKDAYITQIQDAIAFLKAFKDSLGIEFEKKGSCTIQ